VYNHENNAFLNTTTNVETIGSPGLTDTTEFNVAPRIDIGATYAMFPGRFTINAGIGLRPFNYTHTATRYSRGSTHSTQTTTVLDSNGREISRDVILVGNPTTDIVTDRITRADAWSAFTLNAIGGFRFNFSENMAVDMAAAGGAPSGTFTLNLANVRVLFTLKF